MRGGPVFLDVEEILLLHLDQIRRYGGTPEVRDIGLLESAAAMPQAGARGEYFHSDLFEMAAAYLFHIVKNRPFADGNKRTGVAAALVFLELNGIGIRAPHASLARMVTKCVEGRLDKPGITAFFRRQVRR